MVGPTAALPEIRLVLLGSVVEPDERTWSAMRRLIQGGPDWKTVLRWGGRHGMLPSLHARLGALIGLTPEVPPHVPEPVLDALRRRYLETSARNLRAMARLAHLIHELEGAGIPAVALKGPALAATVYEDPAHREFGDLDLLVRPRDLDAAREILAEQGLQPLDDLRGGQEPAFRAVWYAYCLRDPATETLLELHWRIAPLYFPLAIDPDRMWEETEEITVHGRTLRGFRPEMQLLLLCVHGAKHEPDAWGRLKWIRDVAQIVTARPELDWDELLALADESGCRRILHVGLRLASSLLGARLPPPVEERTRDDPVASALARQLESRLLTEGAASTPLDRLRFELRIRERRSDRLRLLTRRALVPDTRDLTSVRLPRWLYPLYVPLRLLRLVGTLLRNPGRIRHLFRPMKRKPPMVRA